MVNLAQYIHLHPIKVALALRSGMDSHDGFGSYTNKCFFLISRDFCKQHKLKHHKYMCDGFLFPIAKDEQSSTLRLNTINNVSSVTNSICFAQY